MSTVGHKQPFTCVVARTFKRRLRSVTGRPIVKDERSVFGHCRHSRPVKYVGREWPLSRKSNAPSVSENWRVELLLRLSDSVARRYRVHSTGPVSRNGLCQSIQSYESLWCAQAQFLGGLGLITSTTWFDAKSTSLRSFFLVRCLIFWKFVWS